MTRRVILIRPSRNGHLPALPETFAELRAEQRRAARLSRARRARIYDREQEES